MNVLKSLVKGITFTGSKEEKSDEIPPAQPHDGSADNDASHDDTTDDRKRLWTKVSGLIGKDTTSLLSLPVSLFEPISVLQSMCEPLRHADILDKCCEQEDEIDRICYVAAYTVALYSGYTRTKKPFNPVLGETFEFIPQNKSYRTISEQVSHHPPIGIVHTIAPDRWTLQQESHIQAKFWGNSVDINGIGHNHLTLTKYGDHFSWNNPTSCCHNIIFGRMWIEHFGTVPIVNNKTGDVATINFKKGGWFEGINYDITGEAHDKDGNLKAVISGKWNDHVSITRVDENGNKGTPIIFWKAAPEPEITNKWKWPKFVYELTALDDEYEAILPPTDSRLRADLRALEAHDAKLAAKEKNKIEERERQKRKEREAQGIKWSPIYFKKVDDEKFEYRWEYVGNYWEEKDQRIKESKERESSKTKTVKVQVDESKQDQQATQNPDPTSENSA